MLRARLASVPASCLSAAACVALVAGSLPAQTPPDIPAFVFVSRSILPVTDPTKRVGPVERASQGKLFVWEGGVVRTLVDWRASWPPGATPRDVIDPSVSWDGARVVFSGYSVQEEAWRIYEVGADGTGLRQITRSDRELDLERYGPVAPQVSAYHDVDPCYLPDGRICFVSTRYPGLVPDGRFQATNLHVVNADGTDLHRITSERFGADTPTVDPSTGRIVYSRWWRTLQAVADSRGQADAGVAVKPIPPGGYYQPPPAERDPELVLENGRSLISPSILRGIDPGSFTGVNSWFLASIRPDGTGLQMFSGFRLDRELTQAYRPSFFRTGEAIALFIHEAPFLGAPGRNGLRKFQPGAVRPQALGGPQTFQGFREFFRGFVYSSAEALPDGRILATAAPFPPDNGGSLEYDVYLQEDGPSPPVRLFGRNSTEELDAVPLVARDVPPILADGATVRMTQDTPRSIEEAYQGGSFRFISENIFFNGPVNLAIPLAPPVGRRLSIEFYMAPQRTRDFPADPPILLGSQEIPPGGRVEAELPAGVPLFEIIRRPDGSIAVGRDGQVYHVGGLNFGEAGQEARCVGCHAGHTMIAMPEDPSWTNLASSAVVTASSTRTDQPGLFEPKALVDRRTDPIISEWMAGAHEEETSVELRWNVPIQARQVVIYGTEPKTDGGLLGPRNQTIRGLIVETYSSWFHVERHSLDESIVPGGIAVDLDPGRAFDALVITFHGSHVAGLLEGQAGPGLAEVEVLGKVAPSGVAPTLHFVRGDSNCNGRVDLSDATTILGALFMGRSGLCCAAAADTNDDEAMNLTDAVHVLNHLFKGGPAPASPYPSCGPSRETALECDEERCP